MTTVESGTAINIEYVPDETRAVAIHEAGHAVASHVFMKDTESTRLSIRMRGQSLGHHQALEKEERFSKWRSEQMAALIWTLGAMAAERVFYDENSTGVGGDVQSATARAAFMVGASAMGPERVELNGAFKKDEDRDEAREKMMKRFEEIGIQIMNRTGGGPFAHDPISGALSDPDKRKAAAQILGQAYVKAFNLIQANKEAVSQHRGRRRRAARDLRRRAARPAQGRQADRADDRLRRGELMAQAVEPIAEGPGDREAPLGAPGRRASSSRSPSRRSAFRPPTCSKEEAVYPGRFMVGYLLIVLFFGALLVAFAVGLEPACVRRRGHRPRPGRSSSRPPTPRSQRTRQIARFVGAALPDPRRRADRARARRAAGRRRTRR